MFYTPDLLRLIATIFIAVTCVVIGDTAGKLRAACRVDAAAPPQRPWTPFDGAQDGGTDRLRRNLHRKGLDPDRTLPTLAPGSACQDRRSTEKPGHNLGTTAAWAVSKSVAGRHWCRSGRATQRKSRAHHRLQVRATRRAVFLEGRRQRHGASRAYGSSGRRSGDDAGKPDFRTHADRPHGPRREGLARIEPGGKACVLNRNLRGHTAMRATTFR